MANAIIEFFRKVGELVLGVRKLPGKLKRRAQRPKKKPPKRPERGIPGALQGFLRRRHAGWPEYVMLKAQLGVVALFVAAVLFIVLPSAPVVVFVPVVAVLVGYLIYLTRTQLGPAFGRDYPAYRAFICLCIGIVIALIFILKYFPFELSLTSPYRIMVPVVLVFGLVVGSFAAFRLRYGRDYTYGIVQGVRGSRVMVKISYDLCSNVKHGLHFLDSLVRVRRGDLVKVGVERSVFGLRGSRARVVLEKVKYGG
ncbi:MAG: DUF2101 family protein [Candidatus Hadarchaeota archaeon]|nr:DUF2101 family protein [Candidatus Hadarchaeota archaeon]